ncbi:MAG: class I SAM-dependent methyltransferase [Acidobacteria bacterium]|nr:class I SAM-dependent methyltransferase [Acidobacteriota bacterium]
MSGTSRRTGSLVTAFLTVGGLLVGPQSAPAQPQHEQHRAHGHEAGRHMEHRFDDPERYAQSFDDPARDEWQMPARVIAALDVGPGQAVADIGAGTGYFTVRLARETEARTVYAVDIEPSMVDYVRQRADEEGLGNVVGVVAEADSPNLPEPVDLALIVNTYHHIPERVAYFSALRDRLAPGGRIAIIDPRKGAPGGGPPDEFRFTPEEIAEELGRAGFELLTRHDFLPRQSFLVYSARPGDDFGGAR